MRDASDVQASDPGAGGFSSGVTVLTVFPSAVDAAANAYIVVGVR